MQGTQKREGPNSGRTRHRLVSPCRTRRLRRHCRLLLYALIFTSPAAAQRPVTVADLDSLRDVSDPQLSPDGAWVAYSVSAVDTARDADDSDIWMTSWDGARSVRLTRSPAGEHTPRWSPDGRSIAFLSSRDDPQEADQLWILDRQGGEAERVTELPGGVSDYAWAPDGRRVALIVSDSDSVGTAKDDTTRKTPKPIVIDRFQFKEDETGYLTDKREHLYVLDLSTKKAELLLPGQYDEIFPSWSPDGRSIAFVSKRDSDPDRGDNYDVWVVEAKTGAQPRQLTTFKGSDQDPAWGGRGPAWSPDGRYIAYVQGGPPELIYYASQNVAIVPTAGGAAKVLTPGLDRQVLSPTWSADGSSVLFLLEDDRVYHLARVAAAGGAVERVVEGRQAVADLSVTRGGRVAVLTSNPRTPSEIYAVEQGNLRRLTHQNDAWLGRVRLGAVEEIAARSKDGTSIHGFMVTPPDYEPGKRYPTVLRIHGGPVWQLFNDFANFDWQILAAQGYVVVAMNPRGSSGRGEKFTRAIWAAWGHKDTEDVLAGVDYLVGKGVADPERLGIGGWSYGGILTDNVIARDPRFKAATSGAGQGNALAGYGTDQYVREYEAELGKPWEKTDVWIRNSYPLLHANRIVTPTLFLCGDADFNVPLLNSEQMYQALKSLGRDTQLIIYPGEPHELHKPSNRRDRMQRYLDWYGKYLQPKGVVPTTTR
jgi:dipeptidyl aminopeptidase/acylaminoacyl peptidase